MKASVWLLQSISFLNSVHKNWIRLPLYPRLLSSDDGAGLDVWVMTSRFSMCLSVHQNTDDDIELYNFINTLRTFPLIIIMFFFVLPVAFNSANTI